MTRIISADLTPFGRRDQDLITLCAEASHSTVRKYHDLIDMVIVSNSYSGEYCGISGLNSLITTRLSLDRIPSVRIDNTSGSGGSAILMADSLVRSGLAECILVVGGEKMTEVPGKKSTSIIASLLNREERSAGATLPSLAGILAREYMKAFGATRESIASVSVKNHHNGTMNRYAQFQKEFSLQEVMESRIIADPLRLLDYCPVSDGAASVLVTSDSVAETASGEGIQILGCSQSSDSSAISERENITSLKAVRSAVSSVYSKTGLSQDDMDFAELHDMSTILEIVESEEAGFFRKGEGWKAALEGKTALNGEIPINTSGGLISKGHPIGATGIAQATEAYFQLTGRAGGRQVKAPETGLAVNMSGFGNNCTATVYGVVR